MLLLEEMIFRKGKVFIMKTMEQFYNEVMQNDELLEAADKARNANRLGEYLAEHEVNGTAEAFEALVNGKKHSGKELSDEELEKAAGGRNYADMGEADTDDGVKFQFNIGDRVLVLTEYCIIRDRLPRPTAIGEIIDTRIGYSSADTSSYPMYSIEFDGVDGTKVWDDFYQSDIILS